MPKSKFKWLGGVIVVGIISINVLAFAHARAMIHFTDTSSRTQKPEDLDTFSKIKVLLTGVNIPRPDNKQNPSDIGLPFETHEYPSFDGQSLEAWYIPALNEEVLVLLFHGYAESKESLLPVVNELNELGLSVFAVDFFGSGGSTGNRTTIGYLESADVSYSFNYVKSKWPNSTVLLYGQSMGGVAILRSIALDGVNPDAIVLESTYDMMLSTVKNRFVTMGIPSIPMAHLLVFWGGWQAGFNAFEHNPADYAKSVNAPALVLHGQLDPRVTEGQAEAVYQQLGGWKKFSSYPLAGHKETLKSDTERWQEDIKLLVENAITQ